MICAATSVILLLVTQPDGTDLDEVVTNLLDIYIIVCF